MTESIMGSFYILTTPEYDLEGRYKIGITTQTASKLLKQYTRFLPQRYFRLFIETPSYKLIEKGMKHRFNQYSVQGYDEAKSEWFIVPFMDLYNYFNELLQKITPKYPKVETPKVETPGRDS